MIHHAQSRITRQSKAPVSLQVEVRHQLGIVPVTPIACDDIRRLALSRKARQG
jgi:hypothetical protein